MHAGQSARDVARSARENAERQRRRAEMFERGAEGEEATAKVLAGLGAEWISLHDHRWPGRRFANIDHIVIGPAGVFVIDSKNWSGDVRVADGTLWQNGRSREKAVAAATDAALAVAELVGPYAETVRPVLCFTGDRALSGWARDVMICSVGNLSEMLVNRPQVLDAQQVHAVATRIGASMQSAAHVEAQPVVQPPRPVPNAARQPRTTTPPRSKRTKRGRVLVGLAGALFLMLAGPSVFPLVGEAVSTFIVETAKPETVDCEQPHAVAGKAQSGRAIDASPTASASGANRK